MSHVITMELQIKDLNALEVACKELGCQFIKGQTKYNWWGHHVGDYPLPEGFTKEEMGICEHAIKVPNTNWEIGVVKDKQNKDSYKLIYDFYGSEGRKIQNACGNNLGELKKRYTVNAIKNKIKNKKASVKEEKLQNGKMKITINV